MTDDVNLLLAKTSIVMSVMLIFILLVVNSLIAIVGGAQEQLIAKGALGILMIYVSCSGSYFSALYLGDDQKADMAKELSDVCRVLCMGATIISLAVWALNNV